MRLKCPHCNNLLNVVDAQPAVDVSCPSCGSKFPVGAVTVTYRDVTLDRIGHFEIIEKAGVGHFGTVFRARDAQLNRTVAIKLPRSDEINEQYRAMFLREARAAAALDHPNIVRVYEIGEEEEQIYIVSQFVDGVTLRDKLKIHRYAPKEAADFLATIAEAIHFAHDRGVVHRDLKPSNILLDHDGTPHISDFGLAKVNSAEVTVTLTGVILGTPAYMSPEQARGESHSAGPRSDVYSLGVILYEMLTGQRPFDGSTTLLLHQIQSSDPRAPRSISQTIPRDLETICLKALAKSPEKRYATAQDMADDLRRFVAGESIVARRVSRIEKGWRWMRRNPVMTTTALLALFSSTVAVGLGFSNRTTWGLHNPEGAEGKFGQPFRVQLNTEPQGATVIFYPIDESTGLPLRDKGIRPKHRSPIDVELAPNNYLVVATLDDGRFHEVYRLVPRTATQMAWSYPHRWWHYVDGVLQLRRVVIPELDVSNNMSAFEGSTEFRVGLPDQDLIPEHIRDVKPFYLDPHEVTIRDVLNCCQGSLPMPLRDPKQANWESDLLPVSNLLFDEALMIAERLGKRLPTEWEYEFAATNGGTTRYPSGNVPPETDAWQIRPIDQISGEETATIPPVFGLFSNVSEFVDSRFIPYPGSNSQKLANSSHLQDFVTIRGGPLSPQTKANWLTYGPRFRIQHDPRLINRNIGFRCARSRSPRLKAEDF